MKTSRLYNQLQTLLGQSSAWADQRHLQTLIWMVIGVILAECINLPSGLKATDQTSLSCPRKVWRC